MFVLFGEELRFYFVGLLELRLGTLFRYQF